MLLGPLQATRHYNILMHKNQFLSQWGVISSLLRKHDLNLSPPQFWKEVSHTILSFTALKSRESSGRQSAGWEVMLLHIYTGSTGQLESSFQGNEYFWIQQNRPSMGRRRHSSSPEWPQWCPKHRLCSRILLLGLVSRKAQPPVLSCWQSTLCNSGFPFNVTSKSWAKSTIPSWH